MSASCDAVLKMGDGLLELHTIGIDLGKPVFHLVGLRLRGGVVVRKRFTRKQLLHFTANLQVGLIGMEACAGPHLLGRALRGHGHTRVRLIPAQYVKPYVKTNKSDYIDAEAIAEAVGRPTMRFVPIKTDAQLDMQSLHRVRDTATAGECEAGDCSARACAHCCVVVLDDDDLHHVHTVPQRSSS